VSSLPASIGLKPFLARLHRQPAAQRRLFVHADSAELSESQTATLLNAVVGYEGQTVFPEFGADLQSPTKWQPPPDVLRRLQSLLDTPGSGERSVADFVLHTVRTLVSQASGASLTSLTRPEIEVRALLAGLPHRRLMAISISGWILPRGPGGADLRLRGRRALCLVEQAAAGAARV
jgi:hypothetical protein